MTAIGDLYVLSVLNDAVHVVISAGAVGPAPTWWLMNAFTGAVFEVPDSILTSPQASGPMNYHTDLSLLNFSFYPGFVPIPCGNQVLWSPSYSATPRTSVIFAEPPGTGTLVLYAYLTFDNTPAPFSVYGAVLAMGGVAVGAIVGVVTVFPFDMVDTGVKVYDTFIF